MRRPEQAWTLSYGCLVPYKAPLAGPVADIPGTFPFSFSFKADAEMPQGEHQAKVELQMGSRTHRFL